MIPLDLWLQGVELRWSASRHDCFDTCKRKYFYSYIAHKHYPEVERLKKLSALPLWAGNLVHDTLEAYVKMHDRIPTEAEGEAIIHRILYGQMPQDWAYSAGKMKSFRLWEHEYNKVVSQDEKRTIMGLVAQCLRNAFKSDILRELFEVGRKNWLAIEDTLNYNAGKAPAVAKMDLAYKRGDTAVIVDWKSGRFAGKTNKLQVAGYALYAYQAGWAKRPENIETVLAYLLKPEYHKHTVTAEELDKASAAIEAASAEIESYAPGGKGKIEDFPMVNGWPCKRCQFQRLCFPNYK